MLRYALSFKHLHLQNRRVRYVITRVGLALGLRFPSAEE